LNKFPLSNLHIEVVDHDTLLGKIYPKIR